MGCINTAEGRILKVLKYIQNIKANLLMDLPGSYQNIHEYFNDAMQFLYDYQWIFRFPMTGLLVHNVFNNIPVEWQTVLENMSYSELTILSSGNTKIHWPSSLVQFLQKCRQLQLESKTNIEGWELSEKLCRGLSLKKQHEVSRMTVLVHHECEKFGIHRVIDVGSGLGYLDLVLHLDMGYQVLGLESNAAYVNAASRKAASLCANCDEISFSVCEVSGSADSHVLHFLQKRLCDAICTSTCSKLINSKHKVECENLNAVCIIGLHTCGDLSVAATKLFLQIPQIRLMVLVPCCYHKMKKLEDELVDHRCSCFTSFPLSQTLNDILKARFVGFREYLGRPFLRLASQESSCHFQHWSEEQHRLHSENLIARAVLDLAAHQLGLTLRKKKRRCVRKSQRKSFETFLEDVLERYDFILPDSSIIDVHNCKEITEEVRRLWLQNHKLCSLAEALTGLQAAMQAAVESIVLIDKMVYLQEQQSQHLSLDVVKFMDESISPRCRALIARKLR